jgi:hypothetical protein
MTAAEYDGEVLRLRLAGQFLADVKLDQVLAIISHCESITPIVDPTLYLHGAKRLEIVRALAEAGICFQRAFGEFQRGLQDTEDSARRSLEALRAERPR